MTLWIIFAVMLALAVVLVLSPLKQQTAGLEKKKGKKATKSKTLSQKTFAVLGLFIVSLSLGVYILTGNPELGNVPELVSSQRQGIEVPRGVGLEANAKLPPVEVMMDQLKLRLQQNPDDVNGWATLGRSHMALGEFAEAAEAYQKAITLAPNVGELYSARGEALTLEAGGQASLAATQIFQQVLAINPNDPRSQFYLADFSFQQGNFEEALERWVTLYNNSPSGSPWLQILVKRIEAVANQLGKDPSKLFGNRGPESSSANTTEDIQQMSPEDQQAMIEGMVTSLAARLAENPGDLEGWKQLGRSYMVLGRIEEGMKSFAKVAEARPDDLRAQLQYLQTALTVLEQRGEPIPDEVLVTLRRVQILDPENETALFYLGQAALERNDVISARLYWQRLLALLAPDSQDAKTIRQKLQELG